MLTALGVFGPGGDLGDLEDHHLVAGGFKDWDMVGMEHMRSDEVSWNGISWGMEHMISYNFDVGNVGKIKGKAGCQQLP